MTTLGDLIATLPPHSVYPAGKVVPISPVIHGRSFFPGGCGLAFGGSQPYPERPIMLVGQDFSNAPIGVFSHDDWLTQDRVKLQNDEETSPTWRGIRALADQGLLDLQRAYFTNALLGVRLSERSTGEHPARNDRGFVNASLDCLSAQIHQLQPTVIVALGIQPTILLSRRFGLVPQDWDVGNRQWESVDTLGLQFLPVVEHGDLRFAFASCVHPSNPNGRRRSWVTGGVSKVGLSAHRAIWQAIRDHDQSAFAK